MHRHMKQIDYGEKYNKEIQDTREILQWCKMNYDIQTHEKDCGGV